MCPIQTLFNTYTQTEEKSAYTIYLHGISHRSHGPTKVLKQKNTFRLIVHQANSNRTVTLFLRSQLKRVV